MGGEKPVKAGHRVCNLELGRGGEACGGILFNKKACFVLLLNVKCWSVQGRARRPSLGDTAAQIDRWDVRLN